MFKRTPVLPGDNAAGTPTTPLVFAVCDHYRRHRLDKFDYKVMLDFGANTPATSTTSATTGCCSVRVHRPRGRNQIQAGKFKEPV
jgi:hypothetical protein